MKKCGKCKFEYTEQNFYKDSHRKDGLSWDCKKCSSKKHKWYASNSDVPKECARRWRANNKLKTLEHKKQLYQKVKLFQQTYLKRNPCDCGMADLECLDYHHVDQKTLEKRIPAIHTFNKSIEEMTKCIVVCANCHRKIHAGTKINNKQPPTKKELYDLVLELFPNLKKEIAAQFSSSDDL
jgi:hypothetical protein